MVGGDFVAVGFLGSGVCYVEEFPIRGADDAVRLGEAFGGDDWGFGSFWKVVHPLFCLFGVGAVFPVFAFVEGIGEVDASCGVDPEVVGAVEEFFLEVVQENFFLFGPLR